MKNLFFTAVIFLASVSVSLAQSSSNDDASVTAELRAGLTMTNVTDLAFGTVQQAANGSASATVTPGNGAQFNVTGTESADISVTLSTATLTLTGGTGVTVGTWVVHATDGTTYSSGSNILTTSTTGSTTLSETGTKSLWLGGTLSAAASSDPGSYTGTINVAVAYN